eukprot:Amastigsp_a677304_13.p1 type:complete len:154 gc:universal Amastigsp_a677304_13:491-30(-)
MDTAAARRAAEDARFALSGEEYLQKFGILGYLTDAIELAVSRRETAEPLDVLAEYFSGVVAGTHVLFRPFTFVSRTAHNRRAFATQFATIFAQLAAESVLSRGDYIQLIRQLCADFPADAVETIVVRASGASTHARWDAFCRELHAYMSDPAQ